MDCDDLAQGELQARERRARPGLTPVPWPPPLPYRKMLQPVCFTLPSGRWAERCCCGALAT